MILIPRLCPTSTNRAVCGTLPYKIDRPRQLFHRTIGAEGRAAVAWQVEDDTAMPLRQVSNLRIPIPEGAAEAMDEEYSWQAASDDLVMEHRPLALVRFVPRTPLRVSF